jgi:CRISPR-associated protein Cas1
MTVLYVREQGAVVRRDAEELRVTREDRVMQRLPLREVEQVVLCGNVQLTTQAAALLLQHEVDVVFLSFGGAFRGRLAAGGSKFARLRHAQLALSGDAVRSLAVAKGIVAAKLAHQRDLLRELAARPAGQALARAADGVETMRSESRRAGDADSLRGYEGKAGAYYFGALAGLLDRRWSFQGRKYYPPPDPFNALLSFCYGLLQKDVAAAAELVGLDPYLGCFHALQYDRPSLVLDLMEEFRPLAADRAALELVLSGKLTPDKFTFTGRAERPVELGPALLPLVIEAYEKQAGSRTAAPDGSGQNTLRRCMELQARAFARTVMAGRQAYEEVGR